MAIEFYKDGRVKLTGYHYRLLRHKKWLQQDLKCGETDAIKKGRPGCGREITFDEMELHHKNGRGMMGSKRDDTLEATEGLCKKCHKSVTPKPMWSKRHA